MSVAVLQTPLQLEMYERPALEEQYETMDEPVVVVEDEEDRPGQFDVWSAIQAQKTVNPVAADPPAPYVHPLVRRSSSSLSQKSLEICTESLGSETGSDDFSSFLDQLDVECLLTVETDKEEENHDTQDKLVVIKERVWYKKETEKHEVPQERKVKELTSVNYHCSSIRRRSPLRSFPPPLPSISRRDGPCLHMRPYRRDGHLVVDAVPVPSKNYLHVQREDGRLLLSFIDAAFNDPSFDEASSNAIEIEQPEEEHQLIEAVETAQLEEEENNCYEEEEEEEVEVVDRGTVVEVKVSTQPQQPNGSTMKVLRSSLVINKFVGGTPLKEATKTNLNNTSQLQAATAAPVARRLPPTTATTAAAVVVASTLSASAEAYSEHSYGGGGASLPLGDDGQHLLLDNKLLFTSKRRNREEMLRSMRRCSQLRRPLFIWEPCCCIATST